jgi:two-component system cell cycle response regulator
MNTLKHLFPMMQSCRDLAMNYSLVGNPQVIAECQGLEETKSWIFHATLDAAKSHLAGGGAATALPELVET